MSEGWTTSAFRALVRVVGARTGLAFAPSRHDDAEAGIRRAMTRARVTDLGHYLALVEAGDVALDHLVDELTVGETYFFRESSHFELIEREVIPDWLRRRGREHDLRIWSAGCASGEEPYSLAIAVDKAGLATRTNILGTDISRAALTRAQKASYRPWSLRGMDDELLHRYFRESQGRWRLDERVSKRVAFEFLNLACDTYPSLATPVREMDLILCRNVLMYFDPQTITRVARRLHATLAEDGWLLTGPSDPPLGDEAPFETVVDSAGIYYRRAAEQRRPVPRFRAEPTPDLLDETPAAFAEEDDDDSVLGLTTDADTSAAASLRIRALANSAGSEVAERAIVTDVEQHPLSTELHYLHAILLQNLDRDREAVRAVKRALYIDRSLAIAHFLLGSILGRLGDIEAARRAYQNARDLADRRPPAETLALGDGEPAAGLVAAVAAELALIDRRTGVTP